MSGKAKLFIDGKLIAAFDNVEMRPSIPNLDNVYEMPASLLKPLPHYKCSKGCPGTWMLSTSNKCFDCGADQEEIKWEK